ncbi:hypothetical protein ZWY2020_014175 [Hordeum vulgare]|nr:hypothetical protein ZWY2020_014175 [Hordeum vulgare]
MAGLSADLEKLMAKADKLQVPSPPLVFLFSHPPHLYSPCSFQQEDGKEQMAFDLYRAAVSLYVKLEKYSDAAAFHLRLGSAADKCNVINSQCKVYLSAIIIYLYAHDFQQAQKCYNDCSGVQGFLNSDQNRCNETVVCL